jgi:AcrR family transcriptional regulator
MYQMADRSNQRTRTRTALIDAATDLIRQGRGPSMQEAAERALVSLATAYRYFGSADELWREASVAAAELDPMLAAADEEMEAVGDDPVARLTVAVRTIGWRMLDDQVPFRQLARSALERWFAQVDLPPEERTPVREGRRNRHNQKVIEPLRDELSDADLDRLVAALGMVVGTDAMLALVDGVGLDGDDAKAVMLDAARWMLTGALAELQREKP